MSLHHGAGSAGLMELGDRGVGIMMLVVLEVGKGWRGRPGLVICPEEGHIEVLQVCMWCLGLLRRVSEIYVTKVRGK